MSDPDFTAEAEAWANYRKAVSASWDAQFEAEYEAWDTYRRKARRAGFPLESSGSP
ncbi:MAG: hypothetical protein L3K18_09670 [Thermoplasmata archaeon]|nr:hypothetical protein [Thermoplasmata archaeon]